MANRSAHLDKCGITTGKVGGNGHHLVIKSVSYEGPAPARVEKSRVKQHSKRQTRDV